MTSDDFSRRVSAARLSGRAVEAARLVLVDGRGVREAAREIGVDVSIVSRVVVRLRDLEVCRCCGQAVVAR